MVDQALQSNSLAVIDQYIRNVGENLNQLEDATAAVGGERNTLKRKLEELAKKKAELDRNIDIFLTQNKLDLARAAQAQLNSVNTQHDTVLGQLERQEKEFQSLKDARVKLEAKLQTIKIQRDEMQTLLELKKAKEITNRAIKGIKDLEGIGDQDIARIAEKIRKDLDKENARAEVAATNLDKQMDNALETGMLDAQLEERRRRLGVN
jgi:phage shock protein A